MANGDGILTGRFWKRTFERAVKSFGQGAVAGATVINAASDLGWVPGAALTGVAMAVLSVFTSLATATITGDDDPSAVK